ncbi:MAG TPA: hypothetical protein VG890_05715 [Puia sp.]|nr:hypothetical protein [Puia sp.]
MTEKLNSRSTIGYFVLAYIIVTILAYSVSYLLGMILHLPPPPPGTGIFDSPEFLKGVPYHLLINLLTWTVFSYLYFRKNITKNAPITVAAYLGLFWLVLAMLVDLIFFVLIPSPVALTFHQFYIEYQPWISITYGIVLISPMISFALMNLRG